MGPSLLAILYCYLIKGKIAFNDHGIREVNEYTL